MSGSRFAFRREDSFTSGDLGVSFRCSSDESHSDDDSEFLRDIPYTSSSLDRSSIGSIPWADDAIKQNQLDWERVERMFHCQEELTEDADLRNEILEWQRKFPRLFVVKSDHQQESFDTNFRSHRYDSLDLDSFSNLSLNTLTDNDQNLYCANDDGGEDRTLTPTNKNRKESLNGKSQLDSTNSFNLPRQRNRQAAVSQLPIKDLYITSRPRKACQRYGNSQIGQAKQRLKSPNEITPNLHPTPPAQGSVFGRKHSSKQSLLFMPNAVSASITNSEHSKAVTETRMPPILNVLESKRRFCGLAGNNRSFVQLTQIQQPKSAVVTTSEQQKSQRERQHPSTWHLPLAAATLSSRFFNRNSIILPSINPKQSEQKSSSSEDVDNVSFSIPSASLVDNRRRIGRQDIDLIPHQHGHNSTMTPATSSTGRSISAVVHPPPHSRREFNAFYFPYSASKFKIFK